MNGEFQVNDPPKSRIKIFGLIILAFVLFAICFGIYFYLKINKPASFVSQTINFTVKKGAHASEIAEKLGQENVISSPRVFSWYVYLTGRANKIQAGEYLLDKKMTMSEILDIMTAGRTNDSSQKITVIEGWTNDQVAKYLIQKKFATNDEFETALQANYDFEYLNAAKKFSLQGFLFPDTYSAGGVNDLVQKMLDNFSSKFTGQVKLDMEKNNLSISDVVILASIIEKEVGRNKDKVTAEDRKTMNSERELVASVFYNRLKIGMPLQSDATVNYITGGGRRQATLEDIKINSPYNTYVVNGLPPTPISNPGWDSIRAVIYPADSDYLYFLNKTDGEAVFAKTLEEHNANKVKYLK